MNQKIIRYYIFYIAYLPPNNNIIVILHILLKSSLSNDKNDF